MYFPPNTSTHGVIIDTDTYAGSFARELGAFILGVRAWDGAGDNIALWVHSNNAGKYKVPTQLRDLESDWVMEDNGVERPVGIVETPGTSNHQKNSVVLFFDERPSDEQVKAIEARAQMFFNPSTALKNNLSPSDYYGEAGIQVLGIRRVTYTCTETFE